MPGPSTSPSLISSLHQTLLSLHSNPYPTLANPANCLRRASVALIIRVKPSFSNPAPSGKLNALPRETPFAEKLDAFFSSSWVRDGVPEILFIKRAARRGDRWTSQIALPGGKRDPDDPSDEATAERETLEEVGLDMRSVSQSKATDLDTSSDIAVCVGPLSQRVITTDFGAVPLMVLCPFVYLVTTSEIPSLRLQPAEVASAHWIPIPALLDPEARTYERADIMTRTPLKKNKLIQTMLDWNLGQTLYSAIRLRPSESMFSSDSDVLLRLNLQQPSSSIFSHILQVIKEDVQSVLTKLGLIGADPDPSRRLVLWGLTHGVTSDFLALLPMAKGLDWWRWPTLSRSDARFMIWMMSYHFRKTKTDAVLTGRAQSNDPSFVIGEGLGVVASTNQKHDSVKSKLGQVPPLTVYSAAGFLLDGYFEQIQRAVYATLVIRALFGTAVGFYLLRRYRQRQ